MCCVPAAGNGALWELFKRKKAESCLTTLSWIEANMLLEYHKYLFSADEILTRFSYNESSSLFWAVISVSFELPRQFSEGNHKHLALISGT